MGRRRHTIGKDDIVHTTVILTQNPVEPVPDHRTASWNCNVLRDEGFAHRYNKILDHLHRQGLILHKSSSCKGYREVICGGGYVLRYRNLSINDRGLALRDGDLGWIKCDRYARGCGRRYCCR